jgi:putative SOS response-associated peptidase YedK
MCGRYALALGPAEVSEAFGGLEIPDPPDPVFSLPRYNIAPTQPILVLDPVPRWVRWSITPARRPPVINARSETVFRRFSGARRVLVPATGFYEWHRSPAGKWPYYIHPPGTGPWTMAGILRTWTDAAGVSYAGAAVLTTEPNSAVATLHDRMPVIIPPADRARWLDPSTGTVDDLFRALPPEETQIQRVGRAVNRATHEGLDCIAPIESEEAQPEPGSPQMQFDW